MEQDAGMRIDRLSSFLATRAGALHGPSKRGGVHLRHVAARPRIHHFGRARLVKRSGIVENARIAALRLNHVEEDAERGAVHQRLLCARVACFRSFSLAAKVNHPSGQNQGELSQILALRRPLASQQIHRLDQLDPVARGAPQRLVHVGQQGHRARSRGLGGSHHQRRQKLAFLHGAQKRP